MWQVCVYQGYLIVVGDHLYDDSTVDDDKGAVFVYEFDALSTSWKPVGGPFMNDDCNRYFGRIVRLTENGELLVKCGNYDSDVDAVYYYGKQRMGDNYVLQQSI